MYCSYAADFISNLKPSNIRTRPIILHKIKSLALINLRTGVRASTYIDIKTDLGPCDGAVMFHGGKIAFCTEGFDTGAGSAFLVTVDDLLYKFA